MIEDKIAMFVDSGDSRYIDYQPGNGTRYVATAVRLPPAAYGKGVWAVAFPEFGSAYYVNEGAYLDVGYVVEKFGHRRVGEPFTLKSPDIHEMTKAIALLVPGVTADAWTDATGRFPRETLERFRR